jgi:hypothetical protein
VILAKIALGLCVAAAAGAAYICQDGFVHVRVDEYRQNGSHVRLIVPAMLAPIAAACVPAPVLHAHQLREQAGPFLAVLRTAAYELAKLPDSELVDARDHDDHVHVAKIRNGLEVNVHSRDEDVYLWVPLRAAYDAARELESRLRDQ